MQTIRSDIPNYSLDKGLAPRSLTRLQHMVCTSQKEKLLKHEHSFSDNVNFILHSSFLQALTLMQNNVSYDGD
jgi:hypothetical protein